MAHIDSLSTNHVRVSRAALAALLALSCVAGIPRPVHADQGGRESRGHETREREVRAHEFREHEFRRDEFRDSRFHHDHYYPPHGYRFSALPPHPRLAVYGGQRYFFSGGVWYRPWQNEFVVVRPPIGIVVPVLPAFYTRVWVGPHPYYYANDVYYVQGAQGYTVVDPPAGPVAMVPPSGVANVPDNAVTELGPVGNGTLPAVATPVPGVSAAPPATVAQGGGNQLFIYPRQGQTVEQQNRDRSECNGWAISQTGRDPAADGGRMDADFQRAFAACLDGRGYTVK
jgi:hypothetical protein